MSKRKALHRKIPRAKSPRKWLRLQRKIAIAIAVLLGLCLSGGILAHWRNLHVASKTSALLAPMPTPQPLPPPNKPSKEYIYAGNKLIATEEPEPPPAAPSGLQKLGDAHWWLLWTDNSSNETGFKIESSNDGANWTLLTTIEANTTILDLGTNVSPHYYHIIATNQAGDSIPSISIWADFCPKNHYCPDTSPAPPYYSLSLNSSTAYVNVPNSQSLNITGPITVEAWVKTNVNGTFFNRILSRYSNVDGGYALDLYQNKVRFWVLQNSNSTDYITSSTALSPNAWYHVAGVADGSQLRVYINGMLDGSKASNWLPYSGTSSLQIGPQYFQGTLYFPFSGLIDEVRITASSLYNSNFTPQAHLAKDATTRALWKFDDQTASDTSGNGNNGTLMGGATVSTDVAPARELVAWANPTTNLSATGNNLTKNAGSSAAWDGGAVSTLSLVPSDGYLEFTASETTTDRLIGLSTSGVVPSYGAIDFGIRQYYGTLYIIESNGANRGPFGPYAPGDKLRVAIEGGVVKYYKNNTWLRTSTQPVYPLKVDACLYDAGATLNNVVVSGNWQ